MKKVAIVSSYNEECGAAFYSSRLKVHLEAAGFIVDIKRLPVSLLRIGHPAAIRKKGDAEIRRIGSEIAEYDAVFLQFEPGLYGSSLKTSYRRVQHLLKAARKIVVTVHGFHRSTGSGSMMSHALVGKFVHAREALFRSVQYSEIESFWKYVRAAKHVSVMTFCRADQTLLQRFFGIERIANFPITYFDQAEVETIKMSVDRERFLKQYGLDPRRKYFGVCGFLSPYKGHLTAIKALEYLPDDWNLVIVGGEHPQGLEAERDIGEYVRQLLAFILDAEKQNGSSSTGIIRNSDYGDMIARSDLDRLALKEEVFEKSEFKYFLPQSGLRERVKFVGQVSDEAMPKFYATLDYVVHPYIKTKSGQSGSGPATMALEFGARSLFSNAPVFREMGLYFNDAMAYFNVGNFVELAESLQRFDNFQPVLEGHRNKALQIYNPAAMVDAYRQCLET
jgi:glycosyltransferase involved in cell wall biosynthesis